MIIVNDWGSEHFCVEAVTRWIRRSIDPAVDGSAVHAVLEKIEVHRASVTSRIQAGFAPRRVVAAVVGCLLLTACSPGADYPSLFPAVHDLPPPRTDTPLDPNQVQQATEDLISARDRLSAEAQNGQSKNSTGSAKPAANSPGKSSAKTPSGQAAAKRQPGTQLSVGQAPGPDAKQAAGAETK